MTDTDTHSDRLTLIPEQRSLVGRLLWFCLNNRLLVLLGVILVVFWALTCAPFDWDIDAIPRNPVPVDAIPDIGENQQIVFTDWPGHSPRDVDDQITYPLTTELQALKDVETVRARSMFGFSSIYVIFNEKAEFYETRTRLLEKLNSLPPGLLPDGVQPRLGPDATALGQVYWYTLEGRDPDGNPAGGWDLEELRTIQDWDVKAALAAAQGVAEVASVGGFVREYQVDVDPDAMRAHRVTQEDIVRAIRASNIDVSAKTIEMNRVEYFIRGEGFIRDVGDIEEAVVAVRDHVPVLVKHVARVQVGPASRRGALDKEGAEAVGGVVVARFGANPLEVIGNVKEQIKRIAPALPSKTLPDGTVSKVTIVPFYDRTGLIYETLDTLGFALRDQILITIVVVTLMVLHLRSSLLIGLMLPLAVGMGFIAMKFFGIDANIVALSGIAIAIGTIVDMGIVLCENILRHVDESPPDVPRIEAVHRGASEVGGAVLTAVLTTVVGFLPVFVMTGEAGKLYKPLAFTKTFVLIASILLALLALPTGAYILFRRKRRGGWRIPPAVRTAGHWVLYATVAIVVGVILTAYWRPLGKMKGLASNLVFVVVLVGGLIGMFRLFQWGYPWILGWCLRHKALFLSIPGAMLVLAAVIWFGFPTIFASVPAAAEKLGIDEKTVRSTNFWVSGSQAFPGLGKESRPPLDEGSFLFMPSTMFHASIAEAIDVLSEQDKAFRAIPEVEIVVGKIGRVDSPLDPAPISMIETVITYKSEYGRDENGEYVRQWRDHIRSPDDIWEEIVQVGQLPGVTPATMLQPISTRLVMQQTGMRADMGIRVQGPDLESIETAAVAIEQALGGAPNLKPKSAYAQRIVGKPYLVIDPRAEALAGARERYGLNVEDILRSVEVAIGGKRVTTVIDGRKRFPVRVRYSRELRDDIDSLGKILIAGKTGQQVPLGELVDIRYERGPQVIQSENTFKVGYVTFAKLGGKAEVEVIEGAKAFLDAKLAGGELKLPEGITFEFIGAYQNYIKAQRTLSVALPMALLIIFIILYLQFRSVATTLMVFCGVFVAFAGGFLLLWLYSKGWFLDFDVFGRNLRDVFQVHTINLSIAVWVGFLALFGIATDDGVVMGTYLEQSFRKGEAKTTDEIRQAVIVAGTRRVRPCLMTTATTVLALLPVLTAVGRGSDIMVPMAIPSFGGMVIEILTMLVVPVLYCSLKEFRARRSAPDADVT